MQNPIHKFRQSSTGFKKSHFLFEKLKTLTRFDYPRIQYALLKLHTLFLLINIYKRVLEIFYFFYFLFTSWVFCKYQKRPVSKHTFFTFSLITQDIYKTILKTLLQTLLSGKRVQNFSKNIKLCGSWSSSKFSVFQTNSLVSQER